MTSGSEFRLVDLVDDFACFYDVSLHFPQRLRAGGFRAYFETLFPGYYTADRFGSISPREYDRKILDALASYPANHSRWASIERRFAGEFAVAMNGFAMAFPDAVLPGAAYLVHSLGELDGGTRRIHGRDVLVFGVDVMALAHDFHDEQPFLHHELFHVHHSAHFGRCDLLWCAVWAEGLAVATAAALNPGASDEELLLTRPEPLRNAVETHRAEAQDTIRRLAYSNTSEDYETVLGSSRISPTLPPRFGYYVGYLLARHAMIAHPLGELAMMPASASEPLFLRALEELSATTRLDDVSQ